MLSLHGSKDNRRSGLQAGPSGAIVCTPLRGAEGAQWMNLDGLVDVDRGVISREIFVNDEIYRREREQVFGRAWLFVGHASQIPKPGDFLTSFMGEESVILCRDRAA